MVYQDVNGFVQVANMTASGWVLTQVNVNAVVGTGLAMQPQYLGSSGSSGMVADQINLYHQKETLNISLASWVPAPAASNGGETDSKHTKFCTDNSSQWMGYEQPNLSRWSSGDASRSGFIVYKRIKLP